MNFTIKRKILNIIGIVFVLALLIFHKYFYETSIGITVSIIFLLAYLILSLIWWRCPHYNSYLWKLSPFATHCPYCGNKFE